MNLQTIYTYLEALAPLQLAEEWDNSGLLVDCKTNVDKILVALDITPQVADEAKTLGCNLIVSHHPVIFSGMKSINADDVAFKLVQNNISAVCMHTNLDAAKGGVNDLLAEKIGLCNITAIECGGRVGTLQAETDVQSLAQKCKAVLNSDCVRFTKTDKPIKTVCVVGGSGAFLTEAKAANADCLVTGDVKHHEALDAMQMGLALIGASHFATENLVVDYLCKQLSEKFSDIQVIKSSACKEPLSQI